MKGEATPYMNVVLTLKCKGIINVEKYFMVAVVSTLIKHWNIDVETSTLKQRWITVDQRCNYHSTYFRRWSNVVCLLGIYQGVTFLLSAVYTQELHSYSVSCLYQRATFLQCLLSLSESYIPTVSTVFTRELHSYSVYCLYKRATFLYFLLSIPESYMYNRTIYFMLNYFNV